MPLLVVRLVPLKELLEQAPPELRLPAVLRFQMMKVSLFQRLLDFHRKILCGRASLCRRWKDFLILASVSPFGLRTFKCLNLLIDFLI